MHSATPAPDPGYSTTVASHSQPPSKSLETIGCRHGRNRGGWGSSAEGRARRSDQVIPLALGGQEMWHMPSERKHCGAGGASWSASRIAIAPAVPDACVLFSAPCVVSTSQISCPLFDGSRTRKIRIFYRWIVRPSAQAIVAQDARVGCRRLGMTKTTAPDQSLPDGKLAR